jgi:hypothetical protein
MGGLFVVTFVACTAPLPKPPIIEAKSPRTGQILHQDYVELRNELAKLIQRSLRSMSQLD